MELFENKLSGAIISDCRKYRYQLWRQWDNQNHHRTTRRKTSRSN